MNKTGFTLVEVLTTVVIIAVLVSISLPMYTRAIERSRATEAMSSIKTLNDAIYAFFTEKETCPTRFSQLVATLPSSAANNEANTTIDTTFFRFTLSGADTAIPGTDGQCNGVLATRINTGGRYAYKIWNPYSRGTTGKSLSLQCEPIDPSDKKSKTICQSLGLYREAAN